MSERLRIFLGKARGWSKPRPAVLRSSGQKKCPHRGGPLSQGIVHGNAVTCPLHNWVINLETGLAQGADEGEVKTFVVRTEAGRILLESSKFVRNKDAA